MDSSLKKISLNAKDKDVLEDLSGRKVYLRNSFSGNQNEIKNLLEQGKMNALVYLQRQRLGQSLSILEENNLIGTLRKFQKTLGLKKLPNRIECYDISHLSGKFAYGSMVTFVDGKPEKKLYRLFKAKDQNNDFENLKEVLGRRLKKAAEGRGWSLPDLIIIDGGKGQLSSVLDVLNNYHSNFVSESVLGNHLVENVGDLEVCSLAKNLEEVFVGSDNGMFKKFVLEGQIKFLLQRIRDEAHRFAIKNNRKARLKTIQKSELDKIEGVGPKTKLKLLTTFGSIKNLVENLDNNPELVDDLVGSKITEKLRIYFGISY